MTKPEEHTALPWATHTVNGNADPNGVYYSAFRITASGGDFRVANGPNYTEDTRAENEANAAPSAADLLKGTRDE